MLKRLSIMSGNRLSRKVGSRPFLESGCTRGNYRGIIPSAGRIRYDFDNSKSTESAKRFELSKPFELLKPSVT